MCEIINLYYTICYILQHKPLLCFSHTSPEPQEGQMFEVILQLVLLLLFYYFL